jgi:hypothetical protein
MREISLEAEKELASQKGPCSLSWLLLATSIIQNGESEGKKARQDILYADKSRKDHYIFPSP